MKSSQVVIVEGIKGGGLGHYIGLAAIRRLKVPNEPLWASVSPKYYTGNTQRQLCWAFWITAKSKTFVCREQGAEIFLCLSLLCCFICSWGEGTLYCQRPWSHVSNPDPDLKCLKCQIFHFHILGLGHLVFVDIHNHNNNSNTPDQSVQSVPSTSTEQTERS